MIEAIPLNADCIVLIITKVEDPEELDTRFSAFAPSVTEDSDEDSDANTADEVLICSAASRAKTIPQALLKFLLRPLPRRVTVYAPPVPYGI